jgi:hypothetical protein
MRIPPPPLSPVFIWRRRVIGFAVLLLLGGCGTPNGDFGEVQPYLVGDNVHDWVGPYATGSVASKFDLTDDEHALRDLSYPLIEAPYQRQQWYAVLAESGWIKPDRRTADHTLYAKCLLSFDFSSPSARYAQLTDDIRNDITRMPQFFETAGRVLDMDQKRQKSLAYVSTLPPKELQNAQWRMRENQSIVALVQAKLVERAASYHYALERLVIAAPSPLAVDVERAITQMQGVIERYRSPALTWVSEQNLATAR